jgi:hypothetical protein
MVRGCENRGPGALLPALEGVEGWWLVVRVDRLSSTPSSMRAPTAFRS